MAMRLTNEDRLYLTEAVAEGLDAGEVCGRFAELFGQRMEYAQMIWQLRCDAFARLRLSKSHRAFHGGDMAAIRGLDVVSRELAYEYPILGLPGDGNAEKLFEILRLYEGEYQPRRGDAWQDAMSYVRSLHRRGDAYYANQGPEIPF